MPDRLPDGAEDAETFFDAPSAVRRTCGKASVPEASRGIRFSGPRPCRKNGVGGSEQAGEGETGGMIAGHLDPKDLEGLKKADLERMANDMGLDISKAKTKADLIAAITAAEVYAPAEDENGGAL